MLSCKLTVKPGVDSLRLLPYPPEHLASLAYLGISSRLYNIVVIFVNLGFVVVMVVCLAHQLHRHSATTSMKH